ncbi:MAG: helix-turn-helix transcriptional regulator [Oscillospiraceae bacterium]
MQEALLQELNEFLREHLQRQDKSTCIPTQPSSPSAITNDGDGYFDDICMMLNRRETAEADSSTSPSREQEIESFVTENLTCKFNSYLFQVIDQKKMTDSEVYHRAGIDRRVVSKIRSNANYRPTKNTVFAFALGLRLAEQEADELLASVGYSFAQGEITDLIILFCIRHEIYRIDEVNEALLHFDQKLLNEK